MDIKLSDVASWPILTEKAARPIKEYCTKRNFRCKKCKYEMEPNEGSQWTCMFANCPCDWDV